MTTRSSNIAEDMAGGDVIELEAISPNKAHTLFKRSLKRKPRVKDIQIAADLLEWLIYLPLIIR